ncbi:MAG: hypothetical protein FWD11_10015 [Micrococcales bacterium]|nr:hypothetical protein [Micrococcales bacterium]
MAIRILLATADVATIEHWTQVVAEAEQVALDGVGRSLDEVQGLLLGNHETEVLVIDELLEDRGLEFARLLSGANPLLAVVLLADLAGPDQAVEAMEVGARGVLGRSASLADVVGRLEGVAQWVRAARTSSGQDTTGRAGRVIVVAGAKGGVGATTFAMLAAQSMVGVRSVGLVDFDLQAGDLAPYMGVQARRSVVDLVQLATNLSGRVLREITYEVHGLRLLTAPSQGERAEEMTVRAARAIASALRFQFDVSVVDVGNHLTEASAALIEDADQVVLLTTPDLPSLRAARRTLALWERLVVRSPGSVQVVLNRQAKTTEITQQLASRIVETTIVGAIPDGGQGFERLMNTASVLQNPTPVGRAVTSLVTAQTKIQEAQARSERAVDDVVEEIGAKRKGRRGRKKDDQGQSVIEMPIIVFAALLAFLVAAQGIVYAASYLVAREAAHSGARVIAVEGCGQQSKAKQEARKRIASAWDRNTRVNTTCGNVTVDVQVPQIVSLKTMRASVTVPIGESE